MRSAMPLAWIVSYTLHVHHMQPWRIGLILVGHVRNRCAANRSYWKRQLALICFHIQTIRKWFSFSNVSRRKKKSESQLKSPIPPLNQIHCNSWKFIKINDRNSSNCSFKFVSLFKLSLTYSLVNEICGNFLLFVFAVGKVSVIFCPFTFTSFDHILLF